MNIVTYPTGSSYFYVLDGLFPSFKLMKMVFYSNDYDIHRLCLHPQFLATNFPQEQREAVTVIDVCVYFPKISTFDNSFMFWVMTTLYQ